MNEKLVSQEQLAEGSKMRKNQPLLFHLMPAFYLGIVVEPARQTWGLPKGIHYYTYQC